MTYASVLNAGNPVWAKGRKPGVRDFHAVCVKIWSFEPNVTIKYGVACIKFVVVG